MQCLVWCVCVCVGDRVLCVVLFVPRVVCDLSRVVCHMQCVEAFVQ